jgi:vitamin B12 transporter
MKRLLLVFLIPTFLYAQDTDSLPEVLISGNRIETSLMEEGRNVQVLTKKQIEALPVQSVNELLQHVAGLDFKQRGPWGAQADVSLRGGSFDQTLILLNGVKVNDPQTGHHNMNLGIDLNSIKQVEIIKGPAAARYGLNAFNGVINIITEPNETNKMDVHGTFGKADGSMPSNTFYGGFQTRGGVHLGSKKSRHMVSVDHMQSTGYRPNTDLNKTSVFYQSTTKTKVGEIGAIGSFVQNRFGASGFYAFPIDATSEEEVKTILGALQYKKRFGAFMLNANVYQRTNFDTYTLFRNAPEIFQNNHRTDVRGAEFHGAYTYAIGTFGVGLEFRQEAINSNNLGQWVRNNAGVFAENRLWMLDEKLGLNTGVYLNQSNAFGTQVLPSAELTYEILDDLVAFASWGQSFRTPTFTDLYYVGPTNLGNPNLQPETANNFEIGGKLNVANQFFQLSAFNQQSTDLIDWVRDSVTVPWQPQNYEAVSTLGVEFNYTLRLKYQIAEWLTLDQANVGYTWLDMESVASEASISRYALTNLNHQVVGQTSVSFLNDFKLSFTARYLDRETLVDYWLIDARVGYAKENYGVWFDVLNALNTTYTEAGNAPMPGRWFRMGFDVVLD